MKEPIGLFTDCYFPAKPFPTLKREVTKSIKDLKPLWRGMKLHKPRIAYEKYMDGCGCYCNGSMEYPVILLDVESFEEYTDCLYCAVYSTIVHELIHAYLETTGLHCTDYEHPEKKVERLTLEYCDDFMAVKTLITKLDNLVEKILK